MEQDEKLAEINRRLIENEQKLVDLSQEKGRTFSSGQRLKGKRNAGVGIAVYRKEQRLTQLHLEQSTIVLVLIVL